MKNNYQPPSASSIPRPAPPLPWMEWKVGERVVLRRREADGLYDTLGEVLEISPVHVTIQTWKGPVRVPAEKMVTGKKVPPAPTINLGEKTDKK